MKKLLMVLCFLMVGGCLFGQAKMINGVLFVGDPYMARGGMRGISLNNNPQDIEAIYYIRGKQDPQYHGYTTLGGKDIFYQQALIRESAVAGDDEKGRYWVGIISQIMYGVKINIAYKYYASDSSTIYEVYSNGKEEPIFKTSGEWEYKVSDTEIKYYKATQATYNLKGKYPIDCIRIEKKIKVLLNGKENIFTEHDYWLYGFGMIATILVDNGDVFSELYVVE